MTPEETADMLANEMVEDLTKLVEGFEEFASRWTQYGKQFADLQSLGAKARLECRVNTLLRRLNVLSRE